jgi:hypothetical protein
VKRKFTAAVFILAVIFVAAYIAANRGTQMDASAPSSPTAPAAVPASATELQTARNSAPAVPAPSAPAAKIESATNAPAPAQTATPGPELTVNGYAVQDPGARVALGMVGSSPEAEAYWSDAINDPALPAEERKDLIEDLNEDGLADPKHPTPEDLVIIADRIRLVENMAPQAMDQVNADAFAEAYKDLTALYNGQPAN